MWPLSCFRLPKRSIHKPGERENSRRTRLLENLESTNVGTTNRRDVLPVLEVATLGAEWKESVFPVAVVSINLSEGSSASSPRLDILWHNADNVDFWNKLVMEAGNPCLMNVITSMLRNGYPITQVIRVRAPAFANILPGSPSAYPYTNLPSVVPVNINMVKFTDQCGGTVANMAFLIVCRAPLMSHRRVPAHQRKQGNPPAFQNLPTGYSPQPFRHGPAYPAAMAPGAVSTTAAGACSCPVQTAPRHGMYSNSGVNSGGAQHNTSAQRQLDSMVAAHLPAIITVFTLDGRVLHQNPASVAYMSVLPTTKPTASACPHVGARGGEQGTGTAGGGAAAAQENGSARVSCTDFGTAGGGESEDEEQQLVSGLGVLGQIFRYEQAKVRHMLEVLSGIGAVWQGIVRVPPSAHLKRSLVSQEEADPAWEAGSRGGGGVGGEGSLLLPCARNPGWGSGAIGASMAAAAAGTPVAEQRVAGATSNQHVEDNTKDISIGGQAVWVEQQGSQQEPPAGPQPPVPKQVRKLQQSSPSSSSNLQQLQQPQLHDNICDHQQQPQQPSTLQQHAHPPDHLQQSQQEQPQQPRQQGQEQQQATDPLSRSQHSRTDPQTRNIQPHQLPPATSHMLGGPLSRPTSFPSGRRPHTIAQHHIGAIMAGDSRAGGIRGGVGEDAASPVVRVGSASTPFTTLAMLEVTAPSSHGQAYDGEIDPLATSTWTVIADRHTRGWPPLFRSFATPSNPQAQTANSQPHSHSQALLRPPHLTAGNNTIDITAISSVGVGDGSRGGEQRDSEDKGTPPLAANSMGLVELTTRRWGTSSGVQEVQDEGSSLPSLIVGSNDTSDMHAEPMEVEVTTGDTRGGAQGRGVESGKESEEGKRVRVGVWRQGDRTGEVEGPKIGSMGAGGGTAGGRVVEGERAGGGGSRTSGGGDIGMHNNYHQNHRHHNHYSRALSLIDTRTSGPTPQLSNLSTTTTTSVNMHQHSTGMNSSSHPHTANAINAANATNITVPLPLAISVNGPIPQTANITSTPSAGASRVLLFASSLRSAPFNPGLVRRPSQDHIPMLLSARDPNTIASGTNSSITSMTNRQLSQRLPRSRTQHHLPQSSTAGGTGSITEIGATITSSSPAPAPVTVRGLMHIMVESPHGHSGTAPTEDTTTDTALTTTAASTIPGAPNSGPAPRSVSWRPTPPAHHHGDAQQQERAYAEEAEGPREGPSPAAGGQDGKQPLQQHPEPMESVSVKCPAGREQGNAALVAVLRARGSTLVVGRPQPEEAAQLVGAAGEPQSEGPAPNGASGAPQQTDGGGGGETAAPEGALTVLGPPVGRSIGRDSGEEERAVSQGVERRAGSGEGEEGGSVEVSYDTWHEMSAVSAVDPVTGAPVLVVTQVDVSAKVRAERHLVHVMCAERRLLLQLFPRHVLQHVVEANPLLHSSAPSLESLPREWLDGGDWRPVLRDADKLATMHPQATVLFADIAGFDDLCMELPPQQVMAFLNDLFAKFDNSIEPFGVHKMETIGGLFIVAGGLLREEADGAVAVRERWDPLHAEKVFMFAKAMLNVAAKTRLPTLQEPVKLRIGIHTGPVMSGIVGTRVPRFVLFGDTVNTASRMQTSAIPGTVHTSEDTRALLPHESWTSTGGVQIKGKGILHTYVWTPEDTLQYLVPPAHSTTTPDSSNVPTANATGNGSAGTNPNPTATATGGPAPSPSFALNTIDTSSITSSDVFLAQQLSFTAAITPGSNKVKSRLRNEGGGYL